MLTNDFKFNKASHLGVNLTVFLALSGGSCHGDGFAVCKLSSCQDFRSIAMTEQTLSSDEDRVVQLNDLEE